MSDNANEGQQALFGGFAADLSKESEGVWVENLGVKARIRSKKSPEYRKALENAVRPHISRIRRNTMPNEEMEEILKRLMAKVLVLELIANGKNVDQDALLKVLMDRRYDSLYRWIDEEADDVGNFKAAAEEEELGNL